MGIKVTKETALKSLNRINNNQYQDYEEIMKNSNNANISIESFDPETSMNLQIIDGKDYTGKMQLTGTNNTILFSNPKSVIFLNRDENKEVKLSEKNVKIIFTNLAIFTKVSSYIQKDLNLILETIENNINKNKSILINRKGLFEQKDSLYSIDWEFNFKDSTLVLTVLS